MNDSSSTPVISCSGLTKTYRDFWGRAVHPALRGVDLAVTRGDSYALLGPNGSGKTTTLRILLGLLRPTAGEVRLFGRPPSSPAARGDTGFLPESSTLHGFLTCDETLDLYGRLHGVPRRERRERASSLLERVRLTDARKRRVHTLSHGMRRRLALAVAMIGAPSLLVLDEPTAGMDPLVRDDVLGLFREHVEAGGTLLVTSHLLGDISGIARRAALLADGVVAREGDLATMLQRPGLRRYSVRVPPGGETGLDEAVERAAREAGGEIAVRGPERASIEELFVATYRRRAHDGPDAQEGPEGQEGPGEAGGARA